MPWLTLHPVEPYTGAPLTITLEPSAFKNLPEAIVLESSIGSYDLPVREGRAYVTLTSPGNYRLTTKDLSFGFDVRAQSNIPIQTELLLTIGLVLVALGGILRWTQKRKAGSTSPSGPSS